jgi:hypothetical protein
MLGFFMNIRKNSVQELLQRGGPIVREAELAALMFACLQSGKVSHHNDPLGRIREWSRPLAARPLDVIIP